LLRQAVTFVFVCLWLAFASACGGGNNTTSFASPGQGSTVPDFNISVQPRSVSLVPGTTTQIQVSQTPINGFTGVVSLNTNSLPAGVTLSPSLPQNVPSSGLNLSLTAASTIVLGSYSVQLTATSGTEQHSANLGLTVGNRANVSIDIPAPNGNIPQGGSGGVLIYINSDGGVVDFNVELTAVVPNGITATFSSAIVSPNAAVTLTLAASSSMPPGPANVTVQATRSIDGVGVSATIPIYVDPPPGTIPGNRTNWIRLGSNPIAVYYDALRSHVLASLPAINQVDVIDPGSGNLLSSIPVSVANYEPNGVWLASSSNISGTLDGNSLLVLGAGHVATVDLATSEVVNQQALPQAIPIGWTTPNPITPTFLVAASGGHMIFGSWGGSSFYNWDGASALASLHSISDLYSFDRSFDGTKVLVASGDTSGAYQLLDVASDTITAKGAYSNATIMTVRGNPVRSEWAVANSNGMDFLDSQLNLIAHIPAVLVGSLTYWGMTYSADGKYLYFVYDPDGLPFQITVDTSSYFVVRIAPATGTDIEYFRREPPEWVVQPFAADSSGLVFGLGEKGLVIDDSTYNVDPTQATPANFAFSANPDNGPLNASTPVQIGSQSFQAQPDVWFGTQRALAESLSAAGQVSATAPPGQTVGPVNIKLFPPDGYTHVIPQAFSYGTILTSVRHSLCPAAGGCTADIFGFGLFGKDSSKTMVTIGGNNAPVQSVHYFNVDQAYPYPLQYVTVSVPPGTPGRADVVLQSAVGTATLSGAFLYATSLESYASAQTYNALLYDESRDVLYASTNSEIERFSISSSSFLSPITPPSITGHNQFQGMCLTPDGSHLIVANKQDVSVAVIDLANPANSQAISVPATGANAGGPFFVAATSTGKVLISISGFSEPWVGPLFLMDLATSQFQSLTITGTIPGDGMGLYPTADGTMIFLRTYSGFVGFFDSATGQISAASDNFAGSGLGAAAADGTAFAVGLGFLAPDGTSGIGIGVPDELGGFQSFFPNQGALNDSGSLEFAADGTNLFIFDTHHGDLLQSLVLPNQMNVWTKTVALDSSAEHVFLSDSQGLTVLTLPAAPLAIGSLDPSTVSSAGGTLINLTGSGFQPGTVVTIGGNPATATYIDANTLQVSAPAHATGAATMTIQNPSGENYSLDDAVLYQ
jgi:IPT/TIG domain